MEILTPSTIIFDLPQPLSEAAQVFCAEYRRQISALYGVPVIFQSSNGWWPVPESAMTDLLRVARDAYYLQRFTLTESDCEFLRDCCIEPPEVTPSVSEVDAARNTLSGSGESQQ
jgi:hypothetical protein